MIFEMRASDLSEILDMERQYFGRMAWNPSDFTSALDSAYDLPLVFREEGRTIAYSVLRILGPEAEIENLCVLESARRRGIGAMLLDQMLALSLERGVSSVYLGREISRRESSMRGGASSGRESAGIIIDIRVRTGS